MQRILFIDRDGTLIEEPSDNQVDRLDKIRLAPGVIPALTQLKNAGFEFVLVSNQDGLGTGSFPEPDFASAHHFVMGLFETQDIKFIAEFICPHFAQDGCDCRKPKAGLLTRFLTASDLDLVNSYVIGDRDADLGLAQNIGISGIKIDIANNGWQAVVDQVVHKTRRGTAVRRSNETDIHVDVDLDARKESINVNTGIGFFDHMLEQLSKHGGFALNLRCSGDLHIDEHHTVEDCALALGEALRRALGDKRGIARYGFVLPMDETQVQVSMDLSARPNLFFTGNFTRDNVGGLATEMVPHFFKSLADTLGATLHIQMIGDNSHHQVEGIFKAVGRTLRQALSRDGNDLPTTKGLL